jgi:flagellar protein FlaJ
LNVISQLGGITDLSTPFSKKFKNKIAQDLAVANIKATPQELISFAVIVSAFASTICSLSLFSLGLDLTASIALQPAAFAACFYALSTYPRAKARERAEILERDLAIALRTASVELASGASFEKALYSVARGGYGELSKEFKKVLSEIEAGGESVDAALRKLASRTRSLLVQRACMQLVFAYEHGTASEGLKKLAEELSEVQKAKSRNYAAQASFLGLLFIAASCIVPALFAAYVIVGSEFLDLSFTPSDIVLFFIGVFPAADAAVLYYLKSKAPKIMTA